jgi:hypothetical protein
VNESLSSDTRADRVWTYEEVADGARALRSFFASKRIPIHRDSALGVILREAEALDREWKTGTSEGGLARLINAAHANRIAEAIAAIKSDPNAEECLRRIAGNSVDLSKRVPSQGKDALWEIELLANLKRKAIDAQLVDPPDIVIQLNGTPYSVACKKIYSERGVEGQMRKGVKQLRAAGGPGLVAFNIDDLVPENSLLTSKTLREGTDFMVDFNRQFIDRHRQRIQRYVADGRCDGVLVSASVPSSIETVSPQFNNHSQTTLWTLNEVNPIARERLRTLSAQMGALLN